mmetsp:Transcript_109833/g.309705  ORF Transcript_109833/g.309705 Transcript_109833/m.309705 type:complete len:405 (-) Transcript_109833:142-1356(-)
MPLALQGAAPALIACAIASVAPWRGSGVLATALFAYAVRTVWLGWLSLTITIDGVTYKENAASARKRVAVAASAAHGKPPPPPPPRTPPAKSSKDGFLTPREGTDDDGAEAAEACSGGDANLGFREWAPFSPSLPHGEQPGSDAGPPYWLPCEASVFLVRDIRYKQTKEKVPSDFALYDCVGMDMIRDKRRIDCLLDKLPGGADDLPASSSSASAWSPAWGIPRVLVVTCQLPYKAGRIIGAHPEDDGGLSVVSYFVLSPQSAELLSKGSDTPSLRLWRRLVEEGTSTKEGTSFKVIGRVEDLEKYEVPESFHRFNNKPVLLTKSAAICTHRLPEAIEIDYDVRGWVYPAKSTLANYHHRAREAELEIGYVVEGKMDDELPEQILGCFKLINMDITAAQWVSVV